MEEMISNMKKKSDAIDMVLEFMGTRDDAPIEMKIMWIDRQATNIFRKMSMSDKYINLPDDSEIKQSMLTLKEKELEILKQLQDKLNQQ